MQLTTPETVGLAVIAIEGVLSFFSAILPKSSEEETIANNILNLIHGAGFNSSKITQPVSKAEQAKDQYLSNLINETMDLIKKSSDSLGDKQAFTMQSPIPTVATADTSAEATVIPTPTPTTASPTPASAK